MSEERVVLIAVDGSKYAEYAFDFYMQQVHKPTDNVISVYCVEGLHLAAMPMGVGDATLINSMIQEQKEKASKFVKTVADKMKAAGLHGKVKQVHGNPAEEIIRVAEEEKASLIVTGTRGMGTVRRTLIGSVSDYIIHHSHVAVLVCRHKDH